MASKPSKSDINLVILDYLVTEGYPGAAEQFAKETNVCQDYPFDVADIKERVRIRNAIYGGHIEDAISMINDMDAQVLGTNANLHFRLLQLQLIEMIRGVLASGGDNPPAAQFKPAIQFATHQLAPHAATDPAQLQILELTMALMVFRSDKMIPDMKELLDLKLREKVAIEVNKAILATTGTPPQARIVELVRARAWAEEQAKDAGVDLPADTSIGLDGERYSNGLTDEIMSI